MAQEQIPQQQEPQPYSGKEEVIHDAKRYRVHNNYLTIGGGFLGSSLRAQSQQVLAVDFQFHIRREHFQLGALMSGDRFRSNNNIQAHFGYGRRKETKSYNLAAFAGPSYGTGVVAADSGGIVYPRFYEGFGLYGCVQGVAKLTFDFGLGLELFGEISRSQRMFGFKLVAFFSGAYRGPKRNYNPNVRPEKPR